jgi:hypothetical protein
MPYLPARMCDSVLDQAVRSRPTGEVRNDHQDARADKGFADHGSEAVELGITHDRIPHGVYTRLVRQRGTRGTEMPVERKEPLQLVALCGPDRHIHSRASGMLGERRVPA